MEDKQSKITKIKRRNKYQNAKRLAAGLIGVCMIFTGVYKCGYKIGYKNGKNKAIESDMEYITESNIKDYDFNNSYDNKLIADILNTIFDNTSEEEIAKHKDAYDEILFWVDMNTKNLSNSKFIDFINALVKKDSKDSSDVIKKEDIKFFNNLDGKNTLSWDYKKTENGDTYEKSFEISKEAYILERISTYGDYNLYKINDGKQIGIAKGNNLVMIIDNDIYHDIYQNNSIPLKGLDSLNLTNNQLLQKDTLTRDELYNKLVFDINDSLEASPRENNFINSIFVLDTDCVPNFNGDERYAIFVGTNDYYFDEGATICVDINNSHNKLVIQPHLLHPDYYYKYYNYGRYEKDKTYVTDGLAPLNYFLESKGMKAKSSYTLNELNNLAFDINSEENKKVETDDSYELDLYAGFSKELNDLIRKLKR